MVHIEMQAIIPLAVSGTCVPAVPAEDDDVAHVQVDRINSLPILPVIDEELAALLDSQNATEPNVGVRVVRVLGIVER